MAEYEVRSIRVTPARDRRLRGGVKISVDSNGKPFDLNLTPQIALELIQHLSEALRSGEGYR